MRYLLSKIYLDLCSLSFHRWLMVSVFFFCGVGLAAAEQPSGDSVSAVGSGLQVIDWIIVATYACSTVVIGWWIGRKQTNTNEYFVGSGRMNPTLVGVSMFATLLSTITYLAIPGEVLGKGPVYMSNYLAYPIVYVVLAYWLLPAYMEHRVTSAYQLLESRLGLSIRLLGATLFLVLRLFWMSMLVYLTSKALVIMMGIDHRYVPLVVAVTGSFAIAYTSLGGLRAVVVTDLLQTVLLFSGALLVIATISMRMDGFGWIPTQWQADSWDHQPLFTFDLSTRVTVVGSILSVSIWYVCTTGGDQVSVQRLMATEDLPAARRAIAIQMSVATVVGATLAVVGIALLGYFQSHPGELPEGINLKADADQIFPHFIAFHLPPVVSGMVVSGLFAAAMSSVDSGVNSITAVVMTDFVERLRGKPESARKQMSYAKLLAILIGAAVVSLSTVIERIPGNIVEVTTKTVNLISVPIFLLFYFALFVPSSTAAGTWIGVVSSTTVAILVAFSGPIFGRTEQGLDPIGFQWIAPASLVVGIVVGTAASIVHRRWRLTHQ